MNFEQQSRFYCAIKLTETCKKWFLNEMNVFIYGIFYTLTHVRRNKFRQKKKNRNSLLRLVPKSIDKWNTAMLLRFLFFIVNWLMDLMRFVSSQVPNTQRYYRESKKAKQGKTVNENHLLHINNNSYNNSSQLPHRRVKFFFLITSLAIVFHQLWALLMAKI